MFALKTTWGLASASQVVDGTSAPVVAVTDTWTAPKQERKLYITRVVERAPVRRSKAIKFLRVRGRRKAAAKAPKSRKKTAK
jgi:hypothetical protein